MPYASEKQRRFIEAKKPEIAARWRASGHAFVKGKLTKVEKSNKNDWAKAIGAGTAAGALANQFPRVQDIRRKKKGRVKKMLITSTDPDFNQAAAQKAFDLVMKMDDDTAEMFTYIVASDLFESEIEKNLPALQRALNTVFEKRAEEVKKALTKAALNSPPEQFEEFGKAYAALEEITKAKDKSWTGVGAAQKYGYQWEESDFKRDPGTGRFMVKVKHTMTKPLKKEQAEKIIGSHGPEGLNNKQRARYQDEYRQVAAFLGGVNNMGSGNVDVVYHLKDKGDNHFSSMVNTGKPPTEILNDPDVELVAMEAKPTTLTAGGAAYGLAGGLNADQMRRVNTAFSAKTDEGFRNLSSQWANAGVEDKSTSRTFNRLEAAGGLMNTVGAPGSKVQLAGKFAEVVGQFGPEAEQVLGPSARKTAYRYRGTEKTPDKDLVQAYGKEVQDAKRYGVEEKEANQRLLGFGDAYQQKRGDFIAGETRRPMGARERKTISTAPAVGQMGQREALMSARQPTWAEQGMGTALVANYLTQKLPDKHLYRLHLAAGNTPPSEGVIINSKGQLAVQAVGYGDDHYLPFNLKNLKALKGGEYIRNRSVGGLTSEDIYTGLISGARRVTVVSRSGTFTMEFHEDFRGGRRHNDKARRMTRRYENILDAVQSGQVDRQNIPPQWRAEIKREVEEEYAGASRATIRDEVEARVKEFKENPEIEGRDEERAETMISRFEARAAMGDVKEHDVAQYRREVYNELHNMKEVRFRLNGVGYEAGLKSLQEQFPYYIKTAESRPTRDEELLEFALDEGYVEPGRNRPSKARANLFGTKETGQHEFISAAKVDYQRGRAGQGAFKAVEEPGKEQTPAGFGDPKDRGGTASERSLKQQKIQDAFAEQGKVQTAKKAARKLREVAIAGQPDFGDKSPPIWWTMEDAQFDEWRARPENAESFHRFMETEADNWSKPGGVPGFGAAWVNYKAARGATQQVKFQPGNAGHFPVVPYSFADDKGDAYHAGARASVIDVELRRLDRDETQFTTKKVLSQMGNDEMEAEIERTQFLRAQAQGAAINDILAVHAQSTPDAPSVERMKVVLSSDKRVDQHLENIHRARYLNEMKKVAKNPPGGLKPVAGGGASPGVSGVTPPTPSEPRPKSEPGTQRTTTATTVDARKERIEGAKKAIIKLSSDLNAPGTSEIQRKKLKADRAAIDAFGAHMRDHPELTDPQEIDKEMDRQLTDNQQQYVTGLFF